MSTLMAEKLSNAIQVAEEKMIEEKKKAEEKRLAKLNDPNNFVWKGPKRVVAGEIKQDEVKLIDATPEQLNQYLNHCISMLESTDKSNPGRNVLLNIIRDQRERCNTELFMRFVEGSYRQDDTREKYSRFKYLTSIRAYIEANSDWFPKDKMNQILVTSVTSVPEEFKNLTLDLVQQGCLYTPLGVFDKKHITLNFITKLGLWLDDAEKKEFNEESRLTGKNRMDIIKERCNLKPTTNIKISSRGLLNYKEFKAMIDLKTKRYTELTTNQLLVLRNKVLFALESEVQYHIGQWKDMIKKIKQVADINGIELTNYNPSLLS